MMLLYSFKGAFNLLMRLYAPKSDALTGQMELAACGRAVKAASTRRLGSRKRAAKFVSREIPRGSAESLFSLADERDPRPEQGLSHRKRK
jgi:hypothetical protein